MCCPAPGSSWSPPHPVPPRHGRQMPRVRGVLQPRPGQHTSTPLAAEVTPSHNRQPAAPPRCVTCHVSRCRVSITITMPSLKLCISRGSTTTSPAQLGGGWQLGQAANDNNHCWHCCTRCSGAGLNVYILTWMQDEAVLDECFIISINVFICSCVCNCVSINIRTYIH